MYRCRGPQPFKLQEDGRGPGVWCEPGVLICPVEASAGIEADAANKKEEVGERVSGARGGDTRRSRDTLAG